MGNDNKEAFTFIVPNFCLESYKQNITSIPETRLHAEYESGIELYSSKIICIYFLKLNINSKQRIGKS